MLTVVIPLGWDIILTRGEKKKRLKDKLHQMKDGRAKEEAQLRLIGLPPKSKGTLNYP